MGSKTVFLLMALLFVNINHLNAETRQKKNRAASQPRSSQKALPTIQSPKTSVAAPSVVNKQPLVTQAEYIRRVSAHVGPGLFILDGDLHYGAELGFSVRISDRTPIYLGVDTGAYGMTSESGNNYYFPVMGSVLARFDVNESSLHPILGVSAGVAFQQLSDSDGATSNNSYFLGIARAGVEIDLAKSFSLSLEPRVGLMKGNLLFNPVVGFSIGL